MRNCSYKPEERLITVRYDDNEKEELLLPANVRREWAATYAEEHDLELRILEDDIEVKPIGSDYFMCVAKAYIYFGEKLIASGVAGTVATLVDLNSLVQRAATKAKSRALANAGFDCSTRDDDSDLFPAESGYKVYIDSNGNAVGKVVTETADPVDDVPFVDSSDAQDQDESASTAPVLSFEEARDYPITVGPNKGKTVGQLAAEKLMNVRWFATTFKGDPKLSAACRIFLETTGQM